MDTINDVVLDEINTNTFNPTEEEILKNDMLHSANMKVINDYTVAEREISERPFFSIIIPCYESHKTIKDLLDSIVTQNLYPDELEVIIADDCSPDKSYLEIVKSYCDRLHIVITSTERNWSPGMTRQAGLRLAKGRYCCWADHDDRFIENSLQVVKKEIENNILDGNLEPSFVITDFIEWDVENNKFIRLHHKTTNWNHGKFYSLDRLIKPYGLCFSDIISHEDIEFSCKVECVMHILKEQPLYIPTTTYVWNSRPQSVSKRRYDKNYTFLEVFLDDYIRATSNVYIDEYKKGNLDTEFAAEGAVSGLLYSYFYEQGFEFKNPENYRRENLDHIRNLLIKIKETFGLDNKKIIDYYKGNTRIYFNSRESAYIGVGYFIENTSFYDFLQKLHKDIEIKKSVIQQYYVPDLNKGE